MFNSFLSWTELNRRCAFRFVNGGQIEERTLAVSTLKIKQPPHLPGGEAVYVDISGRRVSNLSSIKCFRDFSLSWDELGDDTDDFAYIVSRLLQTQIGGGEIYFSPTFPWNPDRATLVLYDVKDDTLGIVFDKQAKMMPAEIELKSTELYDFGAQEPGEIVLPNENPPVYQNIGLRIASEFDFPQYQNIGINAEA